MSLRASLCSVIPEHTAQIAHAAFPKGNPYLRVRDALGPVYTNAAFASGFSRNSRGVFHI
jgi:transposase